MNPANAGEGIAVMLVSDAAGVYEYACWYTDAGEVKVEKRSSLTGLPIQTHQLVGAERTALALPVLFDLHCHLAIAIAGDGRLFLWGNMHDHPLRMLRSNSPGDITAWTAATLPGVGASCSYPTPIQHTDGSLRVYFRDGPSGAGSGRGDSHIFDCPAGSSTFGTSRTIFKGLKVANAKGPGIIGDDYTAGDTKYNWNAYPTNIVVQPVTGGYLEHWAWVWRSNDPADTRGLGRTNVLPSYMYFDSRDGLWHTITGATVALPVDPVNTIAVQTGIVDDGEGFENVGGLTLDDNGFPHMILSIRKHYHVWWDGSSWQKQQVGTNTVTGGVLGNTVIGSQQILSRVIPYWVRGQLWMLGTGGHVGGGALEQQIVRLWNLVGDNVVMSGFTPSTTEGAALGFAFAGPFEPVADPVAYRARQVVNVMIPGPRREPIISSFGKAAKLGPGGTGTKHGQTTVRVPGSIDHTGATDVSDAFNAWLATVPDNRRILGPAGVAAPIYTINKTLGLTGRNGLSWAISGWTLQQTTDGTELGGGARTRSFFDVIDTQDMLFDGGATAIIRGANALGGTADAAQVTALEAQHIWNCLGAQGLEITGIEGLLIYGDFLYLSTHIGGSWQRCTDVLFHNCVMHNNGRQGVTLNGVDRYEDHDLNLYAIRHSMYDLEPTSVHGEVHDVHSHNNQYGSHKLGFLSGSGGQAGGGDSAPMTDILFENSTSTSHYGQILFGTELVRRGPFGWKNMRASKNYGTPPTTLFSGLSGYTTLNAPAALMLFVNVDGLTVTDSRLPLQVRSPAMWAVGQHGCTSVDVARNDLTEIDGSGSSAQQLTSF